MNIYKLIALFALTFTIGAWFGIGLMCLMFIAKDDDSN